MNCFTWNAGELSEGIAVAQTAEGMAVEVGFREHLGPYVLLDREDPPEVEGSMIYWARPDLSRKLVLCDGLGSEPHDALIRYILPYLAEGAGAQVVIKGDEPELLGGPCDISNSWGYVRQVDVLIQMRPDSAVQIPRQYSDGKMLWDTHALFCRRGWVGVMSWEQFAEHHISLPNPDSAMSRCVAYMHEHSR